MNQKEIFLITLSIFLTIIAWIIADLYHVATTQKVYVKNQKYLKELTVKIDKTVFLELQKRK